MSFEAVKGQSFASHEDWINRASQVLTSHPDYHNTEFDGPKRGWRGSHFTTMCFDQRGRRVRTGKDFKAAKDDGAFPVWWIWPDQIADLIMGEGTPASRADSAQETPPQADAPAPEEDA